MSGRISDERFTELSAEYEQEQAALKARAAELRAEQAKAQEASANVDRFMNIVRKYTSFEELTPTLLREFVEKIVVHESVALDGKRRGKRILSLNGLSEKTIAVHSPEDALVETLEQQEREEMRRLLMEGLDSCLTPAQRRRLWLSCVCSHTVRQISQTENANFQNVAKSIAAAKKKLRKFLSKQGDKTSF